MSVLSRIRISPQQRFDLEDLLAGQSAERTDAKFWTEQFLSGQNYILKGFKVAGIGLTEATVDVTEATLINSENTSDFSWFVIDPATTSIVIPDADLADGQRNFVEVCLVTESGTPVTKAFWDPGAAAGAGAEFNQETDTITDLAIQLQINTGGFSGDPDKLPVAIVDVDVSGNITGIRDKRNLFFRLGTGSDASNVFTFASREEPEITLSISGTVGSYTVGEEVTFTSGASATVSQGGTSSIKIRLPSSDSFLAGDTVTGVDSGTTGILVDYEEAFTGADKDIDDFKEALNALMTELKNIKGTDFWYQDAKVSITEAFANIGFSVLAGVTANARFRWTGSELIITDDNGTPTDTDPLVNLRRFDRADDITLTRQDATSSGIALADDEVLYIELPSTGNRTYSDAGSGASNYRVAARGDVDLDDSLYWLAFRQGTKVYLRGLGELEAGEERQVNDETPEALQQFLGFDPETATSVPYTATPNSSNFSNLFTTSDDLTTAISANTANINDLGAALGAPVYDENILVVSGAPGVNELTGPVSAGTNITLPLNSRDGNSVQQYVVGNGVLEIYLNGQYYNPGPDTWSEVGTAGNPSTEIQINRSLEVGDALTFRMDATGTFKVITTGSPTVSLQDAYNQGRAVTTSTGQPIEISGPASEKLFRVLGDMEVTGVLDPQGVTFSRESSNPISTFDGLYVDNAGDLIYNKNGTGTTNISQAVSGAGSSAKLEDTYDNQSGVSIAKATPVRIDTSGNIEMIDPSIEDEVDAIVGVTAETIADASSGSITFKGRLVNVSTSIPVGSPAYLSKSGILTEVKPTVGSSGFIAGDFVVRIGTIVINRTNPLQKDLLVDIKIIGQL